MPGVLHLRLDPPRRRAAGSVVVRGVRRQRVAVGVRLFSDDGHCGLGEALPLPGYSPDDADIAEAVLRQVAQRAAGGLLTAAMELHDAASILNTALAPHADLLLASPSARFALECALVDLLARRENLPAARWLAGGRGPRPVPVSLLLPDDDEAAAPAAAAAAAAGFSVLKLKIARADRAPDGDARLLGAVRDAVGRAEVLLRLDANGALDAADLLPRLRQAARHGIELVEEPRPGHALLAMPRLPLPWAADESLVDVDLAAALLDLPVDRRPAAFVLKPALLGLARSLELARTASERGLGVIVTHAMDGDLGHAAACAVAAALPQPPWPCGLAPHAGLTRPLPPAPWWVPGDLPGLGVRVSEAQPS